MKITCEGVLLRIFIGEADRCDGKPLYKQIIKKAKELNIAGATVFRGIMGYGANSRVQTASFLRLSEDLPLVIEIVDNEDRIKTLLPWLDEVIDNGLVTMEKAHILKYSPRKRAS